MSALSPPRGTDGTKFRGEPTCRKKAPPQHALIALLAVGLAIVVPCAPWSAASRGEPRAAINRGGVLGGADYLIEASPDWRDRISDELAQRLNGEADVLRLRPTARSAMHG